MRGTGEALRDATYDPCEYKVEYDEHHVTMTVDCKHCNGPSNLRDPRCLNGVIDQLSGEFNVDTLVLGDYIETQYYGPAMKVLRALVRMASELERLSLRYYPMQALNKAQRLQTRRKRSTPCGSCPFDPEEVFGDLRQVLVSDPASFKQALAGKITELEGASDALACPTCIKTTVDDLIYVMDLYKNLRLEILAEEAYRMRYGTI